MENSQKKNIRQERIKALVDKFLTMDYGETLEHYKIEGIINLRQTDTEYQSVIQAAKKQLEEVGRTVKSVRKVGYQLVTPDEYSNVAAAHVRAGAKRISHGKRILDHAPEDKMSPEARDVYRRMNDRMITLAAFMQGARTEVRELTAKKHPLLSQNTAR